MTGGGKHFFSGLKVLYSLVSKMLYFTPLKTHNIILFPCVLLENCLDID